jgi:hypothetical protein
MENAVCLCSWTRSAEGFTLWLKSRPTVRATGSTYAEAEERFLAAIHDAGGPMQAVLEFDRPLPQGALDAKYSQTEIYTICGDDRFETDGPRRQPFESHEEREARLTWIDAFYQSPICKVCGHASSARSERPLKLVSLTRHDGAFGSVGHDAGTTHQIVSDDFLRLLTPTERQLLVFRPTIHRGRRAFHELIGPPGAPSVAVAGLTPSGWRCSACRHANWGYWIEGMTISSFVASSDLPDPLVGVFTVGAVPEIQLAVTAARWRELVGRKGTRGFKSQPLGVVPDHAVIREPELPTRDEWLQQQ